MAITREIYTVGSNGKNKAYAGYAKFGANGEYLGSGGGRTKSGRPVGAGRSQLRNTIRTAGLRGASRNPALRG